MVTATPFDGAKLQGLMDEAQVDAVLASSRHNVRYLTGGYYVPFHAHIARGFSGRYMALVGVPREPAGAFYVGQAAGSGAGEDTALGAFGPVWIEDRRWTGDGGLRPGAAGMTVAAAATAAQALRERGLARGRLAVELPFLPGDAFAVLREELPDATLVDATHLLGELRAVKRPDELALMREVNRATDEAIRAVLRQGGHQQTTRQVEDAVRRRVGREGCTFLFAFVNANDGPGFMRWPSDGVTRGLGRPLQIDAGASLGDYLSDVARMGSVGEPPALAREMFASCCASQDRLRRAIRPGLPCGELHRLGRELTEASPWREHCLLVIHGIGMVNREYPLVVAGSQRPLEPGMVLSVETEYRHPEAGHIKIEDTLAVTPEGCQFLGEPGWEWIVGG